MFASKVFATTMLITTSSVMKKQRAECQGTAAEQGAADLDKIFGAAQAEGGIPPDPEEI